MTLAPDKFYLARTTETGCVAATSDAAIFRNYKSLHIDAAVVEYPGRKDILFLLEHRNALLKAAASDIKQLNLIGERTAGYARATKRYHYFLKDWKLVDGDPQWLEKIYSDFGWVL